MIFANGVQEQLNQRQVELSQTKDRLARAESAAESARELASKHAADAWEAEKGFIAAIRTLSERAALVEQQEAQIRAEGEAKRLLAERLRELTDGLLEQIAVDDQAEELRFAAIREAQRRSYETALADQAAQRVAE